MKKPAVFLAGVGTCALAVASCSTATSPTPASQSGQEADSSVVIIVQLAEGTDGETTLASINEAVASAFPGGSVSVEREYRNALKGYALRAPVGSLDVIRSVSGVQAAYPDGNNNLQ